MADVEKEKKEPPKKDLFAEIVFLFFGFLVIAYFLNGLVSFLQSGNLGRWSFGNLNSRGLVMSLTSPISSLSNPIGSRFTVTKDKAPVYDEPGGSVVGKRKLGDSGQIIGGSVESGGQKYWQVKFDDGTVGWMNEKDIAAKNQKVTPLSEAAKKGDVLGKEAVVTSDSVLVFDSAGGDQIATVSRGARGKIIDGPATVGGERYWRVKFADGTDGWVAERDLGVLEDQKPGIFMRFLLFVFNFMTYWKFITWVVCVILAGVIFFLVEKIGIEREKQRRLIYSETTVEEKEINPKWIRVINHIESQNENDWRLAILEADIMLDDLLDHLNLPGDTIGDKLKAVEKSDFTTVDNAWEAHKIRNQIAHEGAEFLLSAREARRVVELYRSVFEEFKII